MLNRFCIGTFLLACLAMPLTSCNNASSGLDSVLVTPETATLGGGANLQMTATGTFGNGSHPTKQDITTQVTWSSNLVGVATVSNTGLVTAVGAGIANITASAQGYNGIVSSSATITVTGSGSATSEPLASMNVVPTSQTLTTAALTVGYIAIGVTTTGTTVNLTNQTATIGTATIQPATWSSSATSVATIDPATGIATSVSNGTTTITAIAKNPDGTVVTGTATMTVNIPGSPEPLSSLAIVPGSQTLTAALQTANLIAIGTTTTGTTVNLTNQTATIGTATIPAAKWSSSVPSVASIDPATGIVTAHSNGTTAITAITTNPDTTVVTGVATLTVAIPGSGSPEPLASMAIVPGSQTLTAALQTAGLVAIGTTTNNTTVNLTGQTATVNGALIPAATWKSSVPSVASVDPATGIVTAHLNGITAITAMSTNPDGTVVTGVATVTVNIPGSPEPLASLAIVPGSQTLTAALQTANLVAIGTTTTGTTVNLTGQGATIGTSTVPAAVWASSVPSVASINAATGVVTSHSNGTTAITAMSTNPDGTVVTGVATLTVAIPGSGSPEPLASMAIVPGSQTLTAALQTAGLVAIGTTTNNTTVNLTGQTATVNGALIPAATWKSSVPSVASIDPATGIVTAHVNGTTAITATSSNPDGTVVTGVATVTVNIPGSPEPLASLAIVPSSQTLTAALQTAGLVAIGTTTNGTTVNLTNQSATIGTSTILAATWASSVPSVASINAATGVVTAHANGTTAITAMAINPDGTVVTGVATLTVSIPGSPEPLASMAIVPGSQTLTAALQTAGLVAIGTSTNGTTVNLTNQTATINGALIPAATWKSSVPSVASIDPATGIVTAHVNGTTAITAMSTNTDGTVVTGVATVTVSIPGSPEPLASLAIYPGTQTLTAALQTAGLIAIGTTTNGTTVNLTNMPATIGTSTIQAATWASSVPSVASINPATGVVTAHANGTTAITAIASNPDTTVVTGVATLTVSIPGSPEPLASMAIVPASQTLTAANQTAALIAIGTTTNGTTVNLNVPATINGATIPAATWASSVPSVATITSPGVVTAVADGTTVITAMATNPDTTVVTGVATLTVNIPSTPEALLSLTIVPSSQSVASATQTTQFLAIGDFSTNSPTPGYQNMANVSGYTVTWTSSNTQVATIGSSTGIATGVAPGTTAITAIVTNNTDHSGATATATFSVTGPAAEAISALSIFPGTQSITLPLPGSPLQIAQFIAIGTNGSTGLQTDVTSQVTWSSINPLVATITTGGVATALSQGSTTITAVATNPDHSIVTATATLTVANVVAEPLLSVAILPGSQSVASPGLTSQLLAIGTFSSAPVTQDVTKGISSYPITTEWYSSNPSVATVCTTGVICPATPGHITPGLVTSVGQGTTAISVVSSNPDGTLVTNTVPFTVVSGSAETYTALTIYPDSQSASAVSQQSQFFVMGTAGTSGIQYDVTNQVQWCSSNPTIASIVSTLAGSATCTNTVGTTPGLATALFSGVTTITATYTNPDNSKVVASATYTVSIGAAPEPLLSITIIPSSISVGQILDSGNFLAFGNYSTTPTIRDITNEVVWISSAPDVFPVESGGVPGNQAGIVTAYGEGGVTIIAEMVRPAICATNPIPTPSVCTDSNPDGTVVTQTATFTCPIGQCGEPVAAQLATLTVYNTGQNSTTWYVTAPSSGGVADLIHCGPDSGNNTGGSVCIGSYPIGYTVTLTESPTGSSFGGWSENCGGYDPVTQVYTPNLTATCTLTLNSNETVGVIFN